MRIPAMTVECMPAIAAPIRTLARISIGKLTYARLNMKKAMLQPTSAAMNAAMMNRTSYQMGKGARRARTPTKSMLQMPMAIASTPP